jgi:hypothetical protein
MELDDVLLVLGETREGNSDDGAAGVTGEGEAAAALLLDWLMEFT